MRRSVVAGLAFVLGAAASGLVAGDGTATAGPGGVPRGALILFRGGAGCPAGFQRVPAFDGRFLQASNRGGRGGAKTHSHALGPHAHTVPPHTHEVAAVTLNGLINPVPDFTGTTLEDDEAFYVDDPVNGDPHDHFILTDTSAVGLTTDPGGAGVTAEAAHIPPFVRVEVCEKKK